MEKMPQHPKQHRESSPFLPGEPVPSIQLLPDLSQPQLPEPVPPRKEKKAVLPASINNFIQKTYAILQEKQFESIVSWADPSEYFLPQGASQQAMMVEGEGLRGRVPMASSFRIHNLQAFEEVVLPRYFKHSNMSSFVRQLNMYSFHKVRGDKNEIQFQHDKFIKNRPDLLPEIKRKQVDSTNSIPSIGLIPPDNSATVIREADLQFQEAKKENIAVSLEDIHKSPEKRENSSQGQKSAEEQQIHRLAHLQEVNKNLKRLRQQKSLDLKQLMAEKKAQNSDKFNKLIFSLFAAKLAQESQDGYGKEQKEEKKGLEQLHKLMEHLMDSSQTKSFGEYVQMSNKLLLGSGEDEASIKEQWI